MMNLSDLKPPKGAKHAKKRVGRGYGSGHGVTSGRGDKGQKSRSGYHRKRGFEGGQMPLHRRLPKRGFFNPFRVEYAVVNLDTLNERFAAGTEVTPDLLRTTGVVRSSKLIKILGRGDIETALTVRAHKFSGVASEKIVAAGGRTEVVSRHGAVEDPAVEAPAASPRPDDAGEPSDSAEPVDDDNADDGASSDV
jgi:large subunit ribosomal protein L15